MTEPVLAISNLDKKMRIRVDILDFVTNRVLLIKCKNEKWKPVAYISKSLNETKRNYKIHNKEMLVIIRCLEVWKHFQEEAKGQFDI